jgi:hypothetical protein
MMKKMHKKRMMKKMQNPKRKPWHQKQQMMKKMQNPKRKPRHQSRRFSSYIPISAALTPLTMSLY